MRRSYAFLIWLIGSLLAIAVIGENLYLGLALAFGAGIVFGLVNWLAYRREPHPDPLLPKEREKCESGERAQENS
jgi:hypothetical protein